jgi:hypothetical protein
MKIMKELETRQKEHEAVKQKLQQWQQKLFEIAILSQMPGVVSAEIETFLRDQGWDDNMFEWPKLRATQNIPNYRESQM